MDREGRRLRIAVLGQQGVGKSSFTLRFVQNHFPEVYDPTLEDCYVKKVTIDGELFTLAILDTAGAEEYSAMRDQYEREAKCFIALYDITKRDSFDVPHPYLNNVFDYIEEMKAVTRFKHPSIVLCGNKCDLEDQRQVTTEEGEAKAKELGCAFFEISAKTSKNVEEAFNTVVRQCVNDNIPDDGDATQHARVGGKCIIM